MKKSFNLENAKRIRLEDNEENIINILKQSFSDDDWGKEFAQVIFDKLHHLYVWDEDEGLTPRVKDIIDGWIVDLFFKLCSYNLINTWDIKKYIKNEDQFIHDMLGIKDTFGRESLIRKMYESIKGMQIGFEQGDGTWFRLIKDDKNK